VTKRGRYVAIAVVVAVIALVLWKVPRWCIEQAEKEWVDCENELFESGVRADCRHTGWLVLPKLLPWTRGDARKLASNMAYDHAEDQLKIAAMLDLDAAARDRAARELVDAAHAEPAPHIVFTTSSRLRYGGAEAVLVERAADLDPGYERVLALQAALRNGDAAAVAKIAALAPADKADQFDLAVGAVQCANGERKGGRAAMERYDATYFKQTNAHDRDVQLFAVACDPSYMPQIDPIWKPLAGAAQAVGGGEVEAYVRGTAAESAVVALELAQRHGDHRVEQALVWIAPAVGDGASPREGGLSPWSVLLNGTEWPYMPAIADETAAGLIELAGKAKKPSAKEVASYYGDVEREVFANPVANLKWGAYVLEIEAAQGWARRGDAAHAQASAKQALAIVHEHDVAALHPVGPHLAISTLELAGEWDAAATELEALTASAPENANYRAILAVQRALAFAHAGKLAEAYTVLGPVMAKGLDERTRHAVAWLRAALALATGKTIDVRLPSAPDKLPTIAEPPVALAYWLAVAAAPADKQALARWRAYDESSTRFELAGVLPAVYYVIGRAAGKGDVELWLDTVTASQVDDIQAIAAARAEAARWRGDAAAAKRWDERLVAERALAKDDRTAYLLRAALKP
jgi:hypothetical protein